MALSLTGAGLLVVQVIIDSIIVGVSVSSSLFQLLTSVPKTGFSGESVPAASGRCGGLVYPEKHQPRVWSDPTGGVPPGVRLSPALVLSSVRNGEERLLVRNGGVEAGIAG